MDVRRKRCEDGSPKSAADFLRSVQMERECGVSSPGMQRRALQFTGATVRRLGLEGTWHGHGGCVNRLAWNQHGYRLVSGSDDRCLRIWKYPSKGESINLTTMHEGNIFGVRFLPDTGDDQIVSGSMDSTVQLHRVERSPGRRNISIGRTTCSTTVFENHTGRIKSIEVEPKNSYLFWSASEDGCVRQYDTRERYSNEDRTNKSFANVVIGLSDKEIKGLAINPVRPHELAIGCCIPYVYVYDRRKLSMCTPSHFESSPLVPMIEVCAPHLSKDLHLPRQSYAGCTSVSYGNTGQQLVATFHGDHAYTFDTSGSDGVMLKAYIPPTTYENGEKQQDLIEKSSFLITRNWKGDAALALWLAYTAWTDGTGRDWQPLMQIAHCLSLMNLPKIAKRTVEDFKMRFPSQAARISSLESDIDEVLNREAVGWARQDDERERVVRFGYDEMSGQYALMSAGHLQENETRDFPFDDLDFHQVVDRLWQSDLGRRLIQRYVGHRNIQTDIKEASFMGSNDSFVACGSDDGHVYIYESDTGRCIVALRADEDVVNCVQAHPIDPVIATSGIEPVVRLWSPAGEGENRTVSSSRDIETLIESNQKRMLRGQYTLRIDPDILPMLTESPQLLLRALGEGMRGGVDSDQEEEVPCRMG